MSHTKTTFSSNALADLPTINCIGARKAGYSNKEIMEHLALKSAVAVTKARGAGHSDNTILETACEKILTN